MKKIIVMAFAAVSCGMSGLTDEGVGELRISFDSVVEETVRSVTEIPDTSEFLLTVCDASGNIIYDGKYGGCPEKLEVRAGNYTVSARSIEFTKPAFSAPQFGDEQCAVVDKDGIVNVRLMCRQINSGVRLSISSAFLSAYPDGVLFLKSSKGKLMYSYKEKRTAYFNPGPVSLILSQNGKDEVMMTRELEPQEVVVIGVDVSGAEGASGKTGISMEVDTTRNWSSDRIILGEGGRGKTQETALNVAQARASAPMTDVWVSGYVVGGDLTSAGGSFEEPFKSRSNLILGPRSTTADRNVCIAVQIPAGSLREDLNLVDNPSLLGSKICIHGDLVEEYFSLVGLKNPDDCIIY